jgi:hypothetical protein
LNILLELKKYGKDRQTVFDHFAMHPEQLVSPTTLRETGPEIAEFEAMVASFEVAHSLAELHLIVDVSSDLDELFTNAPDLADPQRIEDTIKAYERHSPKQVLIYKEKIARLRAVVLTPEDAKIYEMRMAAREALKPITEKLEALKKKKDISFEQLEKLKAEYRRLTRAIGGINNHKVDHDR